jgi:hypothetical protein
MIDYINVLFRKKNNKVLFRKKNNKKCENDGKNGGENDGKNGGKNYGENGDENDDENDGENDVKNYSDGNSDIKIIFTNINDYNNILRKLIYIDKNDIFFFDINNNKHLINNNNNKIIVNNIVSKNKNNFYLPYNLISNNYKLNKIYEIGILDNQYSIFINKNITLINNKNIIIINNYDLIQKIKIFIYFNDEYFDEYLLTKIIYNKVIIITNKSSCFNNYYLKDYIVQYDDDTNNLYKTINNTLINYENIYNKIFKNFDINNFNYFLRNNIYNIFNLK